MRILTWFLILVCGGGLFSCQKEMKGEIEHGNLHITIDSVRLEKSHRDDKSYEVYKRLSYVVYGSVRCADTSVKSSVIDFSKFNLDYKKDMTLYGLNHGYYYTGKLNFFGTILQYGGLASIRVVVPQGYAMPFDIVFQADERSSINNVMYDGTPLFSK